MIARMNTNGIFMIAANDTTNDGDDHTTLSCAPPARKAKTCA